MGCRLKELLDIPRLHELFDSLDEIHCMPSAIIDTDGNILSATDWQDICTKFHRVNPTTKKMCIESDRQRGVRHSDPAEHFIYRCPLGLVDAVRSTVMAMLEELKFLVETASAGQQALDLYQEALFAGEPFDLVMLDLTVPGGMGGLETARKILKVNPEAKLIVSSGYADDPVMANYAEYGFTDVVAKPYTLNAISAVLTQALKI